MLDSGQFVVRLKKDMETPGSITGSQAAQSKYITKKANSNCKLIRASLMKSVQSFISYHMTGTSLISAMCWE